MIYTDFDTTFTLMHAIIVTPILKLGKEMKFEPLYTDFDNIMHTL